MIDDQESDCVPFFSSDKRQLIFEFVYLIVILLLAIAGTAAVRYCSLNGMLDHASATAIYAALGGFLGGWAYNAKWFYRVTARGRHDQHPYQWQRHKFYWRILIPFVAGAIAFAIFMLISSGNFIITLRDVNSGRTAFGLSFFFGYFSDLVLSRIAKWTEELLKSNG